MTHRRPSYGVFNNGFGAADRRRERNILVAYRAHGPELLGPDVARPLAVSPLNST